MERPSGAVGAVVAGRVARAMTGRDTFGTVEAGMRADLILVEGNPLEDVRHLRRLRGVMAAGRWYPRKTLERFLSGDGG